MAAPALHGRVGLLCALLSVVQFSLGENKVLTAVNITWSSLNFKTLLLWKPEPKNYSYTVEIDGDLSERKKVCNRISQTECDLTNWMKNLREMYVARIYSEGPYSEENIDTPPYEISPPFTPYTQTEIGKPRIKNFTQEGKILRVEIEDPLTPIRFANGSFQNIRDIFKDDLEYTLTYWKDQSTGKKWVAAKSNKFDIQIDAGKSYCFFVQATIMSRINNRDGQKSDQVCTGVNRNDLDGLPLESILIIAFGAIAVLMLIIALPVIVYRCRRSKSAATMKENIPPNL
ncbi:Tissue factor [Varanus komodoensis]|uniref:Tissue factor n=1 Tax=Varanus komodoensis TaxID=61221 RepID=A0A8D2IH56_VARKO|nr:tissue factor isoform X1 [Varanus komodoensis]KAF7243394.1 Tissue factor [Varanus komodoensis]